MTTDTHPPDFVAYFPPKHLSAFTKRVLLALLDDAIQRGNFDRICTTLGLDAPSTPQVQQEAAMYLLRLCRPGTIAMMRHEKDTDYLAKLNALIASGDL